MARRVRTELVVPRAVQSPQCGGDGIRIAPSVGMRSLTPLRFVLVTAAGMAGALAGACGTSEPRTDAERLARGREIVERMSAKLAAAQAFSVTTHEVRTERSASGATRQVKLSRDAVMRRPDRFYSIVSGDRDSQVWYDGIGITVVMHKEKVFGQARAPETLDKALDALHERYGLSTPVADYVYTSPAKALLTDTTTGGWVGRESVGGQDADHLAFKDHGIDWEIWIPATGDPLPVKAINEFPDGKRLRKIELTFSNWNLSPQIGADRFKPTVPADYEGVAMVQRARVLKNVPQE